MIEKTKEFWKGVIEDRGIKRYDKKIELFLLFSSLWVGLITSSVWCALLYIPINFMLMSLPKKYDSFWFRTLIQTLAGCMIWAITDIFPAIFCFLSLCHNLGNLDDGHHGFLHGAYGHKLVAAVEVDATSKDVGAGESLE